MSQISMRDFLEEDRTAYIRLSETFYRSDAVDHTIPNEYFSRTFDQCMENSPYVRGIALLHDENFAGYALLSITWTKDDERFLDFYKGVIRKYILLLFPDNPFHYMLSC